MPKSNSDIRSYHRLTVEDLVQAQQIFHSDIFDRDNVVATAVGLYRRRDHKHARTFANSYIKRGGEDPSWPCLLVFVNKWEERSEILKRDEGDYDVIPRYVSLPDRRRVPTCVILVQDVDAIPPPLYQRLSFPTWLMGGGYPVLRYAQEEDRAGSIGCLVTDGANVFALTNRHVTGAGGEVIETFIRGERQRIGVAHAKQIEKVDLDKAYPGFRIGNGWAMPVTYSNVDAGLVFIDNVNLWTAQVYGVGELGPLYDLSADTMSLDLIGAPVRAFGAASGELTGEIQGFFYRYRTVNGVGFVSDLLIGPRRNSALATIPGDSGTLWCLDDSRAGRGARARKLRPIALQWGGHVFSDGETRYQVALATGLSTVLRALDVDIISSWNTGHSEYWGKVGHYKVAATACALANRKTAFGKFIDDNATNIAYTDPDIEQGQVSPAKGAFCPLADVADIVWRNTRKKDSANHFADMDQEGTGEFDGKTLFDLTKGGANIDVETWVRFYKSIDVDMTHMGALPFRVWQMFDEAVAHLKKKDIDKYLAAMGLMAHYIGDACQPLHVSQFHHGRNEQEKDVHSVYETKMVDRFTIDLVQKVNAISMQPLANVNDGQTAARAAIELMRRTVRTLPPVDVLDAFSESSGRERIPHMWDVLGDRTAKCMADGARTLLMLWESAWAMGNGDAVPASKRKAIKQDRLQELYDDKTFVTSDWLPNMAAVLDSGVPLVPQKLGATVPAAKRSKQKRAPRPAKRPRV